MIFTKQEKHIDKFTRNLNVGTVNFNQSPLIHDDTLPASGRNRCRKVIKGSYASFRKYSQTKSISIRL